MKTHKAQLILNQDHIEPCEHLHLNFHKHFLLCLKQFLVFEKLMHYQGMLASYKFIQKLWVLGTEARWYSIISISVAGCADKCGRRFASAMAWQDGGFSRRWGSGASP